MTLEKEQSSKSISPLRALKTENTMGDPMIPTIDHGILSPSGHVSKRSRDAAMKRTASILFPEGFWEVLGPSATDITTRERERALRRARMLRELASRGMHPMKYAKEADRLESDWL